MGMFDSIYLHKSLKLVGFPSAYFNYEFQTKSIDCVMDIYVLTLKGLYRIPHNSKINVISAQHMDIEQIEVICEKFDNNPDDEIINLYAYETLDTYKDGQSKKYREVEFDLMKNEGGIYTILQLKHDFVSKHPKNNGFTLLQHILNVIDPNNIKVSSTSKLKNKNFMIYGFFVEESKNKKYIVYRDAYVLKQNQNGQHIIRSTLKNVKHKEKVFDKYAIFNTINDAENALKEAVILIQQHKGYYF